MVDEDSSAAGPSSNAAARRPLRGGRIAIATFTICVLSALLSAVSYFSLLRVLNSGTGPAFREPPWAGAVIFVALALVTGLVSAVLARFAGDDGADARAAAIGTSSVVWFVWLIPAFRPNASFLLGALLSAPLLLLCTLPAASLGARIGARGRG